MKPNTLTLEHIDALKPAPFNARQMGKKARAALKASLKKFGFVVPAICAIKGKRILDGHHRIEIAREVGIDSVPVYWVDADNYKDQSALLVAVNKIRGDWDYAKLKDIWVELDTGEGGLEFTGFDAEAMAKVFDYQAPTWGMPDKCPKCGHGLRGEK